MAKMQLAASHGYNEIWQMVNAHNPTEQGLKYKLGHTSVNMAWQCGQNRSLKYTEQRSGHWN